MKVILLSEVASRLRQRRQGRGYLGKFIEECTIEDAIPLDRIKQAREEIQKCVDVLSDDTLASLSMKSGLGMALEKIDKLIEESEGVND